MPIRNGYSNKARLQPSEQEDGFRVLVDRLWPRGLTKVKADVDLWLKEVSPSTELRKWFDHDPAKWNEFKERYKAELENNSQALDTLTDKAEDGVVTLIYAARDEEHNEAVVLKEFILKK